MSTHAPQDGADIISDDVLKQTLLDLPDLIREKVGIERELTEGIDRLLKEVE